MGASWTSELAHAADYRYLAFGNRLGADGTVFGGPRRNQSFWTSGNRQRRKGYVRAGTGRQRFRHGRSVRVVYSVRDRVQTGILRLALADWLLRHGPAIAGAAATSAHRYLQ